MYVHYVSYKDQSNIVLFQAKHRSRVTAYTAKVPETATLETVSVQPMSMAIYVDVIKIVRTIVTTMVNADVMESVPATQNGKDRLIVNVRSRKIQSMSSN